MDEDIVIIDIFVNIFSSIEEIEYEIDLVSQMGESKEKEVALSRLNRLKELKNEARPNSID